MLHPLNKKLMEGIDFGRLLHCVSTKNSEVAQNKRTSLLKFVLQRHTASRLESFMQAVAVSANAVSPRAQASSGNSLLGWPPSPPPPLTRTISCSWPAPGEEEETLDSSLSSLWSSDNDDDIVTSDYSSPHPLKENPATPNPVLMTTNLEHALDFSMVSGDIVEENLPMFAGTLLDSDEDTVIFTEHVDIHTGAASSPTPISMPVVPTPATSVPSTT